MKGKLKMKMRMIMRMIIAAGLVAMGIWQILPAQDFDVTPQEIEAIKTHNGLFTMEQPQLPGEQPLATWIMMARARVINSATVWACEGNERPPNCGIVANRPDNVHGCDSWPYTFSWAKPVSCPPDHTYNFTFWTPTGPMGGYLQVGYWTPGLPPPGTCESPGYLSTRSMPPMEDAACIRNASPTPTPTPTPGPSCPPGWVLVPCPTPPPGYVPVASICCYPPAQCYWGYYPTCGCYAVVCCTQNSCIAVEEGPLKGLVPAYLY